MNQKLCHNLDAYLADDLPEAVAAQFVTHLDDCEACRDAVAQQRWIDGLLNSPLRDEIETPSDALMQSVCATISKPQMSTRLIACIFAAAAALAIAAGWTTLRNWQASDIAAPAEVAMEETTTEHSPAPSLAMNEPPEPPRATFVGGPDVLVVPIASKHPNVTIVRVYQTYQPSYDAQANVGRLEVDRLNGG